MAGMRSALPDLRDEDVIGSPYCVRDYVVDARFGDLGGGAGARLAERGLKLILDYVPNHVAPDHPWLTSHPEYFIRGSEDDLARDPASWLRVGTQIVARGRDPYFPAWPDVVQLNAFSPALREAVRALLRAVGGQCDGVRCDMAMLMTNEVFARTWGLRGARRGVLADRHRHERPGSCSSPRPTGTWSTRSSSRASTTATTSGSTTGSRTRTPPPCAGTSRPTSPIRSGCCASSRTTTSRVRRRRSATRARAAAVVMSTIPGARLYHDGQLDGYRTHIPVFLARGPVEEPDPSLRLFYSRLVGLEISGWRLLEVLDHDDLIAWAFKDHLVVVNFGATDAWGRVQVAVDGELTDLLTGAIYERSGSELQVGLRPWGAHVFSQSSS